MLPLAEQDRQMAVATQTPAVTNRAQQPLGLIAASLVGAVFVLAAAALLLRFLPLLWDQSVGKAILNATNSFVSTALLMTIQVAAAVAAFIVGSKLLASHKGDGIRGGIFLMILAAFILFFCGRFLAAAVGQPFSFGNIIKILILVLPIFGVVQFFRTGYFQKTAVALDQGGWFSVNSYKRTQGQKVRRLTMLGLLLVICTGVWTMMGHNWLSSNEVIKLHGEEVSNRMGDWVIGGTTLYPVASETAEENKARPRHEGGFTLLPDLYMTIPLLLLAGGVWFAWRVINYPTFADFLIATEAEINKVSWPTRKALIRDTIVVLAFLVLITVFLFFVDMFWNYLLSREFIGILPQPKPAEQITNTGTAW
jgi:preprotein translocase SecE subunit